MSIERDNTLFGLPFGLSSLSENLESVVGFTLDDLIQAIRNVDDYLSDMADGYTRKDFEDYEDGDDIDDFSLFAAAWANEDWQVVFLALKTLMEVCE